MVSVRYSPVTHGLLSSEGWGLLFPAMVTRTTQFGWIEFVWPHRLLSFDGLIEIVTVWSPSSYGLVEFVTLWSHKLLNAGGIHVAATSDKTEVIRCNTRPL